LNSLTSTAVAAAAPLIPPSLPLIVGGEAATKSKIDAYDRYICDGIFELLEQQEINSKAETDIEKIKMNAEREEQMEKLQKSETNPIEVVDNNKKEVVKDKVRIGFFDWQ
jgi:hypothetical protein